MLPRLYMLKLSNLKIVEDPKAAKAAAAVVEESQPEPQPEGEVLPLPPSPSLPPLNLTLSPFTSIEEKAPRCTVLYLHLSKMNLFKVRECLFATVRSQIFSLISIDISWASLDTKCLIEFIDEY